MPTVLRLDPYRFFFYSSDRDEPPQVHVARDDKTAKFWIVPVRLAKSLGFRSSELSEIQDLLETHQEDLKESWHALFEE